MKVKSKIKTEDDLNSYNLDLRNYYIGDEELIVYGLITNEDRLYYLINPFNSSKSTPYLCSPKLFNVIDNKLSKYWVSNFIPKGHKFFDQNNIEFTTLQDEFIITFPEWALNPTFYSNLYDWKEHESLIFDKYAKLMYLEFPDEKVEYKGKIALEPDWVECPKCDYTRPENSDLAMLECPNCDTVIHNPFYKEDRIG